MGSLNYSLLLLLVIGTRNLYGYYFEYDPKDDPSTKDFPPSLSLKLDLQNGENAWVFDNVIPFSQRMRAQNVINYIGQNMQFSLANYSWTEEGCASNIGLTPWIVDIDKSELKLLPSWKKLVALLEETIGKKITIERVQKEASHSLDPKPPVTPQYCSKNRYVAKLYFETFWERNSYGQLSFYTEQNNKNISSEPRLEIIETVHPRRGRLVVYPSCQKIVLHPPTPSYFKQMIFLNIWFTTDKDISGKIPPPLFQNKLSYQENRESFSKFEFDSKRNVDIGKCVKRKFFNLNGEKGLFVLDDLFTVEELRAWRKHLIAHSHVQMGEFDSEGLEDNDNVITLSIFSVDAFLKTDMWKRVHEQISFVSGEDKWHPYDVAMNYIQSSDHTRIHPDAEKHQFEYTYLLYLTEGIESKHFGETIWINEMKPTDGITQFTGPGGEEYEPFAAVKPKFGRVAIFRNTVQHSARPLTTQYLGNRLTFAVKVGRDKRKALIKQLYESYDKTGLDDERSYNFHRQLQRGFYDDEKTSKLSTESMEKLHKKWQKLVEKNFYSS